MNVDELMIGDWVYRVDLKEPIPVRILGLEVVNYDTHPMQYIADVFCPKHNNNVGLYMDTICPIPLTAEILEKNGFWCEHDVGYVTEEYEYEIIYSTWNHELRILKNREQILKLKYFDEMCVHELQHVLRLCGINKEIKL